MRAFWRRMRGGAGAGSPAAGESGALDQAGMDSGVGLLDEFGADAESGAPEALGVPEGRLAPGVGRTTGDGRRGSVQRIAVLVAIVAGLVLLSQTPRLLRHLSAFRVERVEVMGTRYLAPHEALEASGITRVSSIFDDPDPWREALLAHPMIAAVEIERRLPSTILVRLAEVEPVALVRTPELRAVDAAARVLPIAPTDGGLDLPVIGIATAVEEGRVADTLAVALVDVTVRLWRLAPGIAERVSEIAPGPGGAVRLWLRDPAGVEVLLARELDPDRLAQLRATMTELESRAELSAVRRIDVRFRDQVVVSL